MYGYIVSFTEQIVCLDEFLLFGETRYVVVTDVVEYHGTLPKLHYYVTAS